MVVIKWLDLVEGLKECSGSHKEENGSIIRCSVTYPYAKINCFTWSRDDNY